MRQSKAPLSIFTSWPTWDAARAALISAEPARYGPLLPVLDRAAAAAGRWHGDQRRPTDAPYIEHLLEALEVLVRGAGVHDPDVLVAVLLHDVVEDTAATLEEVEREFGPGVAELVDWVTKPKAQTQTLTQPADPSQPANRNPPPGPDPTAKRAARTAYLRRLRSAPREAIAVKLADRVSNVQRLDQMPPAFQRRYYAETVTYLVPLAEPWPWFATWYAAWRTHFGHLR
jgi:guanosine-3',5'-bis(diphosphate) 3'-pyrophosphohydrolase